MRTCPVPPRQATRRRKGKATWHVNWPGSLVYDRSEQHQTWTTATFQSLYRSCNFSSYGLGNRMRLAKGIATRGAPGLTTRNKKLLVTRMLSSPYLDKTKSICKFSSCGLGNIFHNLVQYPSLSLVSKAAMQPPRLAQQIITFL